jgi:hypothetical protein
MVHGEEDSWRRTEMPPHCDSLDGPVASAAHAALDADDVTLVLPYVREDAEGEVRTVFSSVRSARSLGDAAREVADRLFLETVVRLHRAGEGASYDGLKPAGLDVGPVIPLAERAIEAGTAHVVAEFLTGVLHAELQQRMEHVRALASRKDASIGDARAYVNAMLGFQVYCHHLFQAMHADAHGDVAPQHAHAQH